MQVSSLVFYSRLSPNKHCSILYSCQLSIRIVTLKLSVAKHRSTLTQKTVLIYSFITPFSSLRTRHYNTLFNPELDMFIYIRANIDVLFALQKNRIPVVLKMWPKTHRDKGPYFLHSGGTIVPCGSERIEQGSTYIWRPRVHISFVGRKHQYRPTKRSS